MIGQLTTVVLYICILPVNLTWKLGQTTINTSHQHEVVKSLLDVLGLAKSPYDNCGANPGSQQQRLWHVYQ